MNEIPYQLAWRMSLANAVEYAFHVVALLARLWALGEGEHHAVGMALVIMTSSMVVRGSTNTNVVRGEEVLRTGCAKGHELMRCKCQFSLAAIGWFLLFSVRSPTALVMGNIAMTWSSQWAMYDVPPAASALVTTIGLAGPGMTRCVLLPACAAMAHALSWLSVKPIETCSLSSEGSGPQTSPMPVASAVQSVATANTKTMAAYGFIVLAVTARISAYLGSSWHWWLWALIASTDIWGASAADWMPAIIACSSPFLAVCSPVTLVSSVAHWLDFDACAIVSGHPGEGEMPTGVYWGAWVEGYQDESATLIGNLLHWSSSGGPTGANVPLGVPSHGMSVENALSRLMRPLHAMFIWLPWLAAKLTDRGIVPHKGDQDRLRPPRVVRNGPLCEGFASLIRERLLRPFDSAVAWTPGGWGFAAEPPPALSLGALSRLLRSTGADSASEGNDIARAVRKSIASLHDWCARWTIARPLETAMKDVTPEASLLDMSDAPSSPYTDTIMKCEHDLVAVTTHGTHGDQQSTRYNAETMSLARSAVLFWEVTSPQVCIEHLGHLETGDPRPSFIGAQAYSELVASLRHYSAINASPANFVVLMNLTCWNPMPSPEFTLPMRLGGAVLDAATLALWGGEASGARVQPAQGGIARSADSQRGLRRSWVPVPRPLRAPGTLKFQGSCTHLDRDMIVNYEQPRRTNWPHEPIASVVTSAFAHHGIGSYATFRLNGAAAILGSDALDRRYLGDLMLNQPCGMHAATAALRAMASMPQALLSNVLVPRGLGTGPNRSLLSMGATMLSLAELLKGLDTLQLLITDGTTQWGTVYRSFGAFLEHTALSDRGVTAATGFAALVVLSCLRTKCGVLSLVSQQSFVLKHVEPALSLMCTLVKGDVPLASGLSASAMNVFMSIRSGCKQQGRATFGLRQVRGLPGMYHPVIQVNDHEMDVNIVDGEGHLRWSPAGPVEWTLPLTTPDEVKWPSKKGSVRLGPYGGVINCHTGMFRIMTTLGMASHNPLIMLFLVGSMAISTPTLGLSIDIPSALNEGIADFLRTLIAAFGHPGDDSTPQP